MDDSKLVGIKESVQKHSRSSQIALDDEGGEQIIPMADYFAYFLITMKEV